MPDLIFAIGSEKLKYFDLLELKLYLSDAPDDTYSKEHILALCEAWLTCEYDQFDDQKILGALLIPHVQRLKSAGKLNGKLYSNGKI